MPDGVDHRSPEDWRYNHSWVHCTDNRRPNVPPPTEGGISYNVHRAASRRRTGPIHTGRAVAVFLLVTATAMCVYPWLPRTYEAVADVLLQPTTAEGQIASHGSSLDALDENRIQAELDVLHSNVLAGQVVDQQGLLNEPELNSDGLARRVRDALRPVFAAVGSIEANVFHWAGRQVPAPTALEAQLPVQRRQAVISSVLSRLSAERYHRSYVLQIGYRSSDPVEAARIANAFAQALLQSQVERKRLLQTHLSSWLDLRVALLTRRYEADDTALHDYLVRSGLLDSSEQSSLQQQLVTLSAAVAAGHDRAVETAEHARVLTELQAAGQLDNAPDVQSSPVIQQMRARQAMLIGGGSAGTTVTGLSELKQAINGEALRIVHAGEASATIARETERQLRAELARVEQALTARQEAERGAQALRRDLASDKATLDDAMGQAKAQNGRDALLQPDAQIVMPATPPARPASPNLISYLAGAVLLAGVMSCLPLMSGFMLPLGRRNPKSVVSLDRRALGHTP